MAKILEKNEMWFYGIIPLVVGMVFLAVDMKLFIMPVNITLWPTLVFLFGLVYLVVSMK